MYKCFRLDRMQNFQIAPDAETAIWSAVFAWVWKRSGRPLRFFVFAQMILHLENNFETDALVQVFLSHFRKNTENWAENLSSQVYTHVFSANYVRKSTCVSYEDRF